jgi:soluble lytic murein transglycosylase
MGVENGRFLRLLASVALLTAAAAPVAADADEAVRPIASALPYLPSPAAQIAPEPVSVSVPSPASVTGDPFSPAVRAAIEFALPPPPEVPEPALALGDPAKVSTDVAAVRQAIELYRKGDVAGGDQIKATLADPAPRALVEWVAIRTGNALGFERMASFLRNHPDWPASALLRRRIEEALLASRKPPAVVRAYFAKEKPTSHAGKLALARAFKADGLDGDAANIIRDCWRTDVFGADFEEKILDDFRDALTTADHRARMERLLFKENWGGASRAASRAGKDYVTLVKARMAVDDRSSKAAAALDAVPPALRTDTSYIFSRAQFLRWKDKPQDAAKLLQGLTRDPKELADGDEWWVERRMLSRKLLDGGDAKAAYEVASQHGAASVEKRIEAEFHSGWIALRFLKDAAIAARHFAEAAKIAETPISVARAAYWQGRAAEFAGSEDEARAFYERAAQHSITYYGQLARAKLGVTYLALHAPSDGREDVRTAFRDSGPGKALRLLYQAGAKDLALPLSAEIAIRLKEPAKLDALGDLIAENRDPRTLVTVGKSAVQRGLPLDLHAYPTFGIPNYDPVGDKVERAMVFAIARQESVFDPKAQSSAGARGLMQLMPDTARRTAKRFGLGFDVDKLTEDPAYNAKIGSAHLGELMDDWKGSFILTFASYNAGGGNVKKWIDAYGDPRKADVDPVDWVERIPFSETRNYVQRVMENLQVYRHRLQERSAYVFDHDLRRGRTVQ